MIPGEVFFRKKFEFTDGGQADKLFVIVNSQRNNQHLVFKTTSQSHEKYRPRKEGCQPQYGFYHIPAGRAWFKKDTWIVLNDPQIMEASRLDDDVLRGGSIVMTTLNDVLIRAIINCFRKTQDCAKAHIWLLD